MPFMQLKTNVAVTEQQETLLKTSFGSAITAIPGKSEAWLMVGIEPQYTLYFQGSDAPAAMVEVSIFGSASDAAYADLTARICKIVAETLHIDASRIYVKYAEVEHWGWNGSNYSAISIASIALFNKFPSMMLRSNTLIFKSFGIVIEHFKWTFLFFISCNL